MSDHLKHYKIHPCCALFPKPDAEQYAAMKASIVARGGLTDPIVSWCGKIVEGKTRLEICEETGIDPGAFREWKSSAKAITIEQQEAELWEWIKAKNIDRRHMTPAQIAAVLVDHAKLMGVGKPKKDIPSTGGNKVATRADERTSAAEIAKEAKQSVATVERIVAVKNKAEPKVFEAIKEGKATPRDAELVSRESPKAQRQAVRDVESGVTKTLKESVEKHKQQSEPATKLDDDAKEIERHSASLKGMFDRAEKTLADLFNAVDRKRDANKEFGSQRHKRFEKTLRELGESLADCQTHSGSVLKLWEETKRQGLQ